MKKKIVLIIIALLIIGAGVALYFVLTKKDDNTGKKREAAIVDRIDGYDYTLDDRDTNLFREEFQNLKTILTTEEVDFDKYAESLAKLFVIDFYTLNTKINKYDVGSLEYLKKEDVDTFKLKAGDTVYKYLEDDSNHDRNQELPEVKEVTNVTVAKADGGNYTVEIEWDYVQDLEYDNKATIKFVKVDKKLCLLEYTPDTKSE